MSCKALEKSSMKHTKMDMMITGHQELTFEV